MATCVHKPQINIDPPPPPPGIQDLCGDLGDEGGGLRLLEIQLQGPFGFSAFRVLRS